MLIGVLKAIGSPGSLGFLLFGAAISALFLVWKRTRRLGKGMLCLLAALYVALSLPVVADLVSGPGTERAAPLSSYGSFDEIFVLDGDNYRSRAATAAQLAEVAKPNVVWFLGGVDLGFQLLNAGLPPKLWRQAPSPARTTRTQIGWIKKSIARTGARRAALVVSRLQAPRVAALANQEQLEIVIVPSGLDDEPPASGLLYWLPSRAGLALSREALYERFALTYYRRSGWID